MLDRLKTHFVPALIHALYSIVYFLFIIPFDMWVKAIERLALQKENGSLQLSRISSPWPFLSFLKALLLEFLFDFLIFIWYAVGLIIAIITLIKTGSVTAFLLGVVSTYYAPVTFTIARDFFQLCLLPIRKFISWCRKPAQYFDLNMQKKEIQ